MGELFNFIVEFKARNDGISPTQREIGKACDITSTSVVSFLLRKLEESGKIEFLAKDGEARAIKVVGGQWNFNS